MRTKKHIILTLLSLILVSQNCRSQELIANVYGRNYQLLNGKWNAIIDPYDQGIRMGMFKNKKPVGKTDFYEYSFEEGLILNVPSDWNSQIPELKFYEGTVWLLAIWTSRKRKTKDCYYTSMQSVIVVKCT